MLHPARPNDTVGQNMTPFFATSYEGLAEGLIVLNFWLVAVVLLIVAAISTSFQKSRRIGRRLAVLAIVAACIELAVFTFYAMTTKMGAGWILTSLALLPALLAAFLFWLGRPANLGTHGNQPPSAANKEK